MRGTRRKPRQAAAPDHADECGMRQHRNAQRQQPLSTHGLRLEQSAGQVHSEASTSTSAPPRRSPAGQQPPAAALPIIRGGALRAASPGGSPPSPQPETPPRPASRPRDFAPSTAIAAIGPHGAHHAGQRIAASVGVPHPRSRRALEDDGAECLRRAANLLPRRGHRELPALAAGPFQRLARHLQLVSGLSDDIASTGISLDSASASHNALNTAIGWCSAEAMNARQRREAAEGPDRKRTAH